MLYNGHDRVNPPPRPNPDSDATVLTQELENEDEEYDFRYIINNERLHQITKTESISEYYENQQLNWISHVIRRDNQNLCKILTFYSIKAKRRGRRTASILQRAVEKSGMTTSQFLKASFQKSNR